MKITTQLPIGKLTVDISSRRVVHLLAHTDFGEKKLYLNQIIFRAELEKDSFVKRGWTCTTTFNQDMIDKITELDQVFLGSGFTIFDLDGEVLY